MKVHQNDSHFREENGGRLWLDVGGGKWAIV